MTTIEFFLSKLEGVKPNGNGWTALCPAHNDTNPSLSIAQGTNGQDVVFTCHAGCSREDILKKMNMKWSDICTGESNQSTKLLLQKAKTGFSSFEQAVAWIEQKENKRLVMTSPYKKDGVEVFRILRFENKDGDKTFRPLHQVETKWVIGDPEGQLPLYNVDGINGQTRIFVVEGEKCADAGLSIGLPVVTSSHGSNSAKNTDWTPLRDTKEIVIILDNDLEGVHYAQDVNEILNEQNRKAVVKIIELPDMEPGQDLYDFLERRDSVEPETLCEIINDLADACVTKKLESDKGAGDKSAFESKPILISMDTIEPEEYDWLWEGKFALGKLATMAGEGGLGKSTIMIDVAARVSTGRPWPDNPMSSQPIGSTIILTAEDDLADTVRPRLDRSGANPAKIKILKAILQEEREKWFDIAQDLPHLESAIQTVGDCRLVIIDPVSAYLGTIDSHNNSDVRGVLGPLSALANQYHISIVLVTHLNKSNTVNVADRIMGSGAFVHAPRTVWAVTQDRGQEEEAKEGIDRRLMLMVKSNLSFPYGLAYRIIDGELKWETDPVKMTAKQFFADCGERTTAPVRYEVKMWLVDLLRKNGPMWAADIKCEAEGECHSLRTVHTAKKALGIKSNKDGKNRWYWSLAIHGDQKPKDANDNE